MYDIALGSVVFFLLVVYILVALVDMGLRALWSETPRANRRIP